jgi:hypothetical protein
VPPDLRSDFLQRGERRVDVAEGGAIVAVPGNLGDRDRRA